MEIFALSIEGNKVQVVKRLFTLSSCNEIVIISSEKVKFLANFVSPLTFNLT